MQFEKKFGNIWKKNKDCSYDFDVIDKLLKEYKDPTNDKMQQNTT